GFSTDGKRVLVRDETGVKAWNLITGQLVDDATDTLPEKSPLDVTSPDAKWRVYDERGSIVYGEVKDIAERDAYEARLWKESWERHVATLPAYHREQLAESQKEGNLFAQAYHLRKLLAKHAFADLDYAVELKRVEAQMDRQAPMPRAVPPR
ncbi:MAG: hypothetical protein ACRCZF_24810, partial [Gemmataceae bacterium]